MSKTKNYLSGLATGYTVTFVTIFVALWLTPFSLTFLNREEYAIFTLAGDMLMWLGLLDLGISSGLNVKAAQLTGKPNQERLNRLASTAFFSQNFVSLSILLIGLGLSFLFPRFFDIRPELHQEAIQMMVLMVIGVAVNIFVQTFSSLLIANQQIYMDNLIKLSLIVIRTALTVVFLLLGWKMLSLAVANLVATIITSFLAMVRVRHLLPNLQIRRKWFSRDVLKEIGALGIWFSLGGLAGMVILNLDRIVTGKLISVELVTTLSLTGRTYALFGSQLQQITNTARPMLGQLLGAGKLKQAYQRYRQIFFVSTGVTIVISASLLAFNVGFVHWWVGAENYGGIWLDAALALNMVSNAWVLPNRAILSSNLIVRPQTTSRLIEGALNITLSILFAKWLGVVGIVFATAVAGIITSNWYLPLLTSRMFNRPYKQFLKEDAFRLFFFANFMLGLALGCRLWLNLNANFLAHIILSGLVGILGVLLFWFVVLEPKFREDLIGQLTHILAPLLKISTAPK